MPKNIVVFSDGTGQQGGLREEQRLSNVYKLYRVCRVGPDSGIDPREQVAFYDPGLGTDGSATGFVSAYRYLQKLLSSVTGLGITKNIADCYEFIVNHYEPGDRVFLIGFSRGAYTVRCVANVLYLCGVPTTAPGEYLPRFRRATRLIAEEAVLRVYEYGAGSPLAQYATERDELARRFREKYGSGDAQGSNVAPHFIGVFDTVASLGATGPRRWGIGLALGIVASLVCAIPAAVIDLAFDTGFWLPLLSFAALLAVIVLWRWLPTAVKTIENSPVDGKTHRHIAQWRSGNYDRFLSGHVRYGRHAQAIDETRADFPRVGWGLKGGVRQRVGEEPEPLLQFWFAGNHSDVGGSYPEAESRLSDVALSWMVGEATTIPNPLRVDGMAPGDDHTGRLHLNPAFDGIQHCEVASMHDTIAGMFPSRLMPWLGRFGWPVKPRKVVAGMAVHPSVYRRFELAEVTQCAGRGPYRPEALRGHPDFQAGYAAAPSPTATTRGDAG